MSSIAEERLDDLRENVNDLLNYEIISDVELKKVLDREDVFEASTADMLAHIPKALKNDFLDGLIARRRRRFDKEVLEVLSTTITWVTVERGPPRYGENTAAE
ncbi:uncharacterized protein H6S33_003234 [Morchella sextelata]|uniref:uncharacterized protein n=1 Tax=Morchella sextelata TaxID=1174677 RepID=UPI001D04C222|nr:uncharacterized protein H6S33_003234 [Morchella sextelata]KAH0607246.1 hypothetical protein H6S33_003234 [Morchella sextelata]